MIELDQNLRYLQKLNSKIKSEAKQNAHVSLSFLMLVATRSRRQNSGGAQTEQAGGWHELEAKGAVCQADGQAAPAHLVPQRRN